VDINKIESVDIVRQRYLSKRQHFPPEQGLSEDIYYFNKIRTTRRIGENTEDALVGLPCKAPWIPVHPCHIHECFGENIIDIYGSLDLVTDIRWCGCTQDPEFSRGGKRRGGVATQHAYKCGRIDIIADAPPDIIRRDDMHL